MATESKYTKVGYELIEQGTEDQAVHLIINPNDIKKEWIIDKFRVQLPPVSDASRTLPQNHNSGFDSCGHVATCYRVEPTNIMDSREPWIVETHVYRAVTRHLQAGEHSELTSYHETRQDAEDYLDKWINVRFLRLNK
jgi:hypothetical protein